ncbi:hypothetical protein KUTeg_022074 [Tegillarca granosa]|uniref:Uncharacterized protein n=1 Tax=Tegillarca granosa TaxID=220873 RepID=A0ABQ9EAR0_TEGGR|nr:hypothetical protein KUTeg_022074 [Tegillarca granosa]
MILGCCQCFPDFRNRIPNGNNVPNPCDASQVWIGVGHKSSGGGGKENPFGIDFESEGKVRIFFHMHKQIVFYILQKWTESLCNMDSDGDGQTNGQELGDPDCTWSTGEKPYRTINISHPGICEPIGSDLCRQRNDWLNCAVSKECPALKEEGLVQKELRIPVTKVPAKETTYTCMIFDLPADDDYHLIATTPIIDNVEMTHHILLFGCDESGSELASTPRAYECGMLAHPKCIYIIGTWTIGSKGDCIHQDTGFRIGTRGFRHAAIQVGFNASIHWNNPNKIDGHTDSSGLLVYLSSNRRQYDAGMFAVGLERLVIPPAQPEVKYSSVCPGECTSAMFPRPIYITRAVNHMHYMGKLKHEKTEMIFRILNFYVFSSPWKIMLHEFNKVSHYTETAYDPPIEVLPGDEVRTSCVYTSIGKNETVYFGAATSNEMCFGFITYYPKQKIRIPYCTMWKSVHKCKRYLPEFKGVYNGCKWMEFVNKTNPRTQMMVGTLRHVCSEMEISGKCPQACIEKVEEFRKDPCLSVKNVKRTMVVINVASVTVDNYYFN